MLTIDGALDMLAGRKTFVWLVPHELLRPDATVGDMTGYVEDLIARSFGGAHAVVQPSDEPALYALATQRAVEQLRGMFPGARAHVLGGDPNASTVICFQLTPETVAVYRSVRIAVLATPPTAKAKVRRGRARQRLHFIPYVLPKAG